MYTYEIVGLADENGKTYESKYGIYNKEKGFRFYRSVISNQTDKGVENIINNLFHEDCWKLKVEKPAKKKMTKEEIETQAKHWIGYSSFDAPECVWMYPERI